MTDREFDRMLAGQLEDLPVEEHAIQSVTPWSTAIGYLTWGLIFTTLHLEFLYLQYLLPTIGFALMMLGLRILRRENRMFFAGWILSMVRALWQLVSLLTDAAPIPLFVSNTTLGLAFTGLSIFQLLLIRQGIKAVFAKAAQPMPADPLLRVVIWQLIATALALSPLAHSWLTFLPMLIVYIAAVRALYSLGGLLDTCGYSIHAAPVRLSPQALGWSYVGLALAVVVAGSLLANHPFYDFQPQNADGLPEVRTQLISLGLPETIAQDLPDETVALLQDTVSVETSSETLLISPKSETVAEYGADGSTFYTNRTSSSGKAIEATTAYLAQPDGSLYALFYAVWTEGRPWWEDGLLVYTEQHDISADLITGGAMYDHDGVRYAGDLRRMRQGEITSTSFFGTATYEGISAAFCFPISSQSPRVYLLCQFPAQTDQVQYVAWMQANYLHTTAPLRLPFGYVEEPTTLRRLERVQQYTTYAPPAP